MKAIIKLFPPVIGEILLRRIDWTTIQEIRVRIGQAIELIYPDRYEWMEDLQPTMDEKTFILNQVSQFSLYRLEEELREGFITIEGGHRIGISGRVNRLDDRIQTIRYISSFNIRVAREKIGVASPFMKSLYKNGCYYSTLIVGPPQSGKTTLLRDITRSISSGWKSATPKKVAVIDERSELGACVHGVPQLDLGKRTDVMDACPKSDGMMMMIRSMSPEVLVVDEIGHQRDVDALKEAINAGVTLLCTVHGHSWEEVQKRPSIQSLLNEHVFERFIIMNRAIGQKQSNLVLDHQGKSLSDATRRKCDEVDWSDAFTRSDYVGRV
ncbi:stage III sporulation protein AA [Thalassobacillus hwangdonensis]|uniref:Stage III sporulation protein AA n=1 Tax=Thalassobacillus hwangdonensis TaxID=546108 RepID=A0ABW3KXU3_9BACI